MLHGDYYTLDNGYETFCSGCFSPLPFSSAPDARFSTVNVERTGANSSYHGLQVSTEKRLSHGLAIQANYTFSHCLDENSNAGALIFSASTQQVTLLPNGLRDLRGSCDYDVRHSLNASYVYALPFHSNQGWLQAAIGDWQLSGTVFVRGGFPLTVLTNGIYSGIHNNYGEAYANAVPGQDPYAKTPIPGVTQPGTIQWLNPAAFQSVIDPSTQNCFPVNSPQNCQNGNAGRNSVRGPGFTWTDFDVAKQFRLSERLRFKFETQFYNLFNHPNFGIPNNGFPQAGIPSRPATLTGFGTINATVAPSTGLLGSRIGGDSSVRMIAFRGTIQF